MKIISLICKNILYWLIAIDILYNILDELITRNEIESSLNMSAISTLNTTVATFDPFTESTVEEIVELGFPRKQVIFEFRRYKGDKKLAIDTLFAESLKR
jgi:hypothetical protein